MSLILSCEVDIDYGRISICDLNTDEDLKGYLYFEDQHWNQGFAWVPGNVNFLMLDGEFHDAFVEICLASELILCTDTVRAIQVPFSVDKSCSIVILNDRFNNKIISGEGFCEKSGVRFHMPTGEYALICELKFRDDEAYLKSEKYINDEQIGLCDMWCRLTFLPQANVTPAILRADGHVSIPPDGVFLMEAEPA